MPENLIINGDLLPTYPNIVPHFGGTIEPAPTPGVLVLTGGNSRHNLDLSSLTAGHAYSFSGNVPVCNNGVVRFRFAQSTSGSGASGNFVVGPAGAPGVEGNAVIGEGGSFGPLYFTASGNEQTLLETSEAIDSASPVLIHVGPHRLGE